VQPTGAGAIVGPMLLARELGEVSIQQGETLGERGERIDPIHFPQTGMVSLKAEHVAVLRAMHSLARKYPSRLVLTGGAKVTAAKRSGSWRRKIYRLRAEGIGGSAPSRSRDNSTPAICWIELSRRCSAAPDRTSVNTSSS
jgi:hypothetical protein